MVYFLESSNNLGNSSRLLYEPITGEHAEKIFTNVSDYRLYSFIPTNKCSTITALQKRYLDLERHGPNDGSCVWLNWIVRNKQTLEYIGWLQATVLDNKKAGIAYIIFPKYWKQGYAREGCRTIITHLVNEYKIEILFAEIDTRNVASIKLVNNLGFTLVETIKNADYFNGSQSDEYRFELSIVNNKYKN